MAFVFNEVVEASVNTAGNTLTFPAMNLAAGSLVVGGIKWEGVGGESITSVTDTALNTYTLTTVKENSDASRVPAVQVFYCLSASANAANVIVVTLSNAIITYRRGRVCEVTTPGATFDVKAVGEATSGTTPVTAAFNTANAAEYVFTVVGGFTSETYSAPLVGGNAANFRGTSAAVDTCAYDYITSSAISSGTSTCTMSVSNRWTIVTVAFKEGHGSVLRGPFAGLLDGGMS